MMTYTTKLFNVFLEKKSAFLLGLLLSIIFSTQVLGAPTASYTAIPPFVAENTGKPNVIIALDISGSMKAVAYRDMGAGNWKTGLHDDFDPNKKYFGYFNSIKRYTFNKAYNFFVEDAAGGWDGNFLNWMAMRRMDIVRQVLVGGKVNDRAGEVFGGNTYYVLEGQNEPYDYSFRKSYALSSAYAPYPDGQEFTMANGSIKPTTSANAKAVQIGAELEVGRATMDRKGVNDTPPANPWLDVEFLNTYLNPIVVAQAVSYNGADPTVVRVKDVDALDTTIGPNGGFRIRLQEWDYKDGNHTTEDIIYMVAEAGDHNVPLDSGTLEFSAGSVTTDKVVGTATTFEPVAFASALSTTPVVFSGVSTYNETDQEGDVVTVRMQNITAGGVEVALQEQESNPEVHVNEQIHYIAIVPITGNTTADGIPVEIGSTGPVVSDSWYTKTFTTTFPATPLVALATQTFNGNNTASVRYGDAVNTASALDMQMDEETSNDTETTHVAEDVAYFATLGTTISIRLGVPTEPTGIVQDNSGGMRFGMAVYNYDHTRSPSAMYTGNTVDGGTLYPCYPDINLPLSKRTNYDICLETHVKSPLSNIVTVIEDHPLIWGTTPIAETLYEIYGYVSQKNNGRNGHKYFYDNGTETDYPVGGATSYPSYKVSTDWDPYYYAEYGQTMRCAKTFVLHFNDGAPYRDWDNTNPTSIAGLSPISDGVGPLGLNEMLDDVAFAVRNQDCRSDLTEHQEIISYYVYAALGEGEINNTSTKRMRESAANGGFVDQDSDNTPDPSHPTNFKTYYDTFLGGGTCTVNEWDDDGDCNPDTFYLANDGYELVSELTAAFASIKRRASSGGAASVISASSSGEGAIFQALFHTTMTNSTYDVKWTGDVHGLFIDSEGLIHQDDGDQILEGPGSDKIVDMCFDKGAQTVRVKLSTSKANRPSALQSQTCSTSVFANTLFDIDYLWSGGEWLRDLTDAQALTQTSSFPLAVGSKSRYMLTGIDADGDGLIQPGEAKPFIASTFSSNFGLLQATDATNAAEIVNYMRGKDQVGYRSRQIDASKTWRLGDVVYSTPTPYGRPAENLHLIYFDNATVSAEYLAFKQKYNNRRQVIYAGSNDGVLHAFNGGWYDAQIKKYENGPAGKAQIELGTELWSYIPYNMLPHLKHITDPSYGQTTGNHIYGVDLQPRIFDAKIFADDPDHPKGWGSVLVGGMRFGGGEITVGTTTLRSSFFILDITNPEKKPQLLLEFTDPNLGFTTSTPAPFVHNGVFYLMLGSGPSNTSTGIQTAASTQAGRLFLLNLSTMALEPTFGSGGVLTLPDANSFVSDLTAIDYNLDYNASSIYFGTVSGSGAPWGGKLYRIQTQNEDGSLIAVNAWAATELLDPGAPIVAKPASSVDAAGNRWVFAGTGRYFTRFDATDNSQQYMFGVKEPRNTSGDLTWGTALKGGMVDVSNAEVESISTALTGVSSGTTNLSLPASPTFSDLDEAMQQFDSNYVNGWYRNLSPAGNRVIGEATLFGGTLNHTSYKPSAAICTVDGTAELHVNYFTTGTASGIAIIGEKSTKGVTYPYIETTLDIGSTPALSPSLHTGKGYETDKSTKAFIQTSDGKITEIKQENNEAVRSGESSWRIYN